MMKATIKTNRKNAHFQLSMTVNIHGEEGMTKKEIAKQLVEDFLTEINAPLRNNYYKSNEVKVIFH